MLEDSELLVTTAALAVLEDVGLAIDELAEDLIEALEVCDADDEGLLAAMMLPVAEALEVCDADDGLLAAMTLPVAEVLATPAEAGVQKTAGV